MSQLRYTLTKLKATGSCSSDDVSMKSIKMARTKLEPLLQHLTNLIIKTGKYPDCMKTTNIVPINKPGKDDWTMDRGHPINIIPMVQILQDQASKIATCREHPRDSARKRQARLGWLPISNEVDYPMFVQAWKMLNLGIPEELGVKMPNNLSGRRIQEQKKLGKKTKWLDKTKVQTKL